MKVHIAVNGDQVPCETHISSGSEHRPTAPSRQVLDKKILRTSVLLAPLEPDDHQLPSEVVQERLRVDGHSLQQAAPQQTLRSLQKFSGKAENSTAYRCHL